MCQSCSLNSGEACRDITGLHVLRLTHASELAHVFKAACVGCRGYYRGRAFLARPGCPFQGPQDAGLVKSGDRKNNGHALAVWPWRRRHKRRAIDPAEMAERGAEQRALMAALNRTTGDVKWQISRRIFERMDRGGRRPRPWAANGAQGYPR